ncbi:MAG TPA: hypothetical protein VMS96_14920 [Terriglobales bacterium]|nr:hypothetical protein [Terriglobales bacterium]
MKVRIPWMAGLLLLAAAASASTLTGKITNGTTKKPQGGDEVVLLSLSQGMQEAARTKASASGEFKFDLPDGGGPHLVRVNHAGVNYFAMVPPGTNTAEVQVFESAPKVEGVSGAVNIMRLQAVSGTLQVTELFAVRNTSAPPRTQMSDQAFEFYLPEGAQVETSLAQGPNGQPVNSAPVPQKEKDRYAFIFPLRPGETRFQVSYHVPYSGQATITPRPLLSFEHLVVMLPSSMKFQPAAGAQFQPMPGENGAEVRVSSSIKPGDKLAFTISGTGQIQETEEASAGSGGKMGGGAQSSQSGQRGRPGGGLGAPEETPDPLHQYRWFILGGLAVVLAVGAFWVTSRPGSQAAEVPVAAAIGRELPPPLIRPPSAPAREPGNRLLEALKEELFQLELDRHQGRISQAEYDNARAALDVTIQRAASRQKS